MRIEELPAAYGDAVKQFNHAAGRSDGDRVTGSLCGGLTVLRDLLYLRLHDDVERIIGKDSVLVPVSETKTRRLTRIEIELLQIAESKTAACDFGYLGPNGDWYLDWLARLRLTDQGMEPRTSQRLREYASQTPQARRLAFTDMLARIIPELRRAPLVLFHLFPLSVRIVTAMAFGDHAHALQLREEQVTCLPAILECRQCHGSLMENGERCPGCDNPLWKAEFLAAD